MEARARARGGTAGLYVVDGETGTVLAARHEHDPFNPASNAKLVTAAVALRVLGAEHRFVTALCGAVNAPSLDELIIRGDGDPSLRTADVWSMANELAISGVRRVGDIVVDQGLFDDQYVPPAYEQQPSEWAPFRAPVAPVSLNRNTVSFFIRATQVGLHAAIETDPPGFVDVSGAVATVNQDDVEKVFVELEPKGMRLIAKIGGTVPAYRRAFQLVKRVHDPRLLVGYAFRAVLQRLGVDVSGEVRLGRGTAAATLVSHESARLGEVLTALGKDSDNFTAEMLFKAIGAKVTGRPGTAGDAATTAEAELRRLGAFEGGVVVRNGSGLFDANRATPASLVALLRAMYRDPFAGPDFVAQLSVGGVDGTLRHRFRDGAWRGVIRAKTGTLNGVAALSGYVLGPNGHGTTVFSALINGVGNTTAEAHASLDNVVEALARRTWPPAGNRAQ
jgi:D-alanyl-D-alanine carboxypeptidase/D-alanyl-D-alanine-endopeptidase (penicillin-binding protein 4)